MLGKTAHKDLEMLKATITSFWGDNCVIEKIEIKDSPFPEFAIHMKLYNALDIGFAYDRGTMDIGIKENDKYIILQKFTDKTVYRGFEVMEPDIMRHNFSVLDEVARQLMQKQNK